VREGRARRARRDVVGLRQAVASPSTLGGARNALEPMESEWRRTDLNDAARLGRPDVSPHRVSNMKQPAPAQPA
jgi:hypothetical protein